MALAIYEGTKKDQLVDEIVDEEILRLLGLENVNDLDYDDYKTLLRERVAAGRMPGNDIPTEDTQKLTEEFKRVKKETGKFKVKNNKIKFDSVVSKATKKSRPVSNPTKTLMGSSVEPEEEEEAPVQSNGGLQNLMEKVGFSLSKIENSLENILGSLTTQQKLQSKISEKERISGEKGKKKEREEKSENSIFKKLGAGAKKIASPIGDIFETIKKFFMAILGGIVALGLIEIFTDPKKFFTKLANGVIDFFNGVIRSVFNFMIGPFNAFIDTMNGALDGFIIGVNDALNTIDFLDVVPNIPSITIPYIPTPQIPTIELPEEVSEPKPLSVPGMEGGGEVTNITNKYYQLMEGGGKVTTNTGDKISSMGSDTQLVALTPGEVVMSKKAVDAYGADTLLGMNASAGGTNRPKMGMVPGYQGGGMVGGENTSSKASGNIQGTNEEKWKAFYAMAQKAGAKYPNLLAAQFALESGWGTALAAKNNFFGIKATKGESATTSNTREVINGQTVYMDEPFKNFDTPQDAVNHLVTQWYKDYRGYTGVNNAPNAFAAADQLLRENYATDPQYASSLKKLITQYSGIEGSEGDIQNFSSNVAAAPGAFSSGGSGGGKSTPTQSTGETAPYEFSLDDVKPMQSPTSQRPMIGVPGGGGGSSVVVAGGGGDQQQVASSAGGGAQSSAPMFSPIDQNNPDLLVIKSIYSIV